MSNIKQERISEEMFGKKQYVYQGETSWFKINMTV